MTHSEVTPTARSDALGIDGEDALRGPHSSAISIEADRTQPTYNAHAITRPSPASERNTSALVGCLIFPPRTRQANTVGDRVMRCLVDGSTHHTSPVMRRTDERSSSRL
jgi:hypothetical protein